MDKINISPFLKLANKLSPTENSNPETMLKLYRNITCRVVGRNKGDTELSLVNTK
jgi:hypothetical protein